MHNATEPAKAGAQEPSGQADSNLCEEIALALANRGWCATDAFISPSLSSRLAGDTRTLSGLDAFRAAGTGRADGFQVDSQVRSDRLKWLDARTCTDAQGAYLQQLDQLRLTINQTLFLGLFELEAHLSIYPPGSFYRRHLDQFRGNNLRTVTTILYLNTNWSEADGGQLRLYTDSVGEDRHQDFLPIAGRLVCFLSDRFPHEVLPTRRERLSITGWFKRRALSRH